MKTDSTVMDYVYNNVRFPSPPHITFHKFYDAKI